MYNGASRQVTIYRNSEREQKPFCDSASGIVRKTFNYLTLCRTGRHFYRKLTTVIRTVITIGVQVITVTVLIIINKNMYFDT